MLAEPVQFQNLPVWGAVLDDTERFSSTSQTHIVTRTNHKDSSYSRESFCFGVVPEYCGKYHVSAPSRPDCRTDLLGLPAKIFTGVSQHANNEELNDNGFR